MRIPLLATLFFASLAFCADNDSSGNWTQLHVAESGDASAPANK